MDKDHQCMFPIDSAIPVWVRIRYSACPKVFNDSIIQSLVASETFLNFSTITVDVLRPLPIHGIAAMMLRAAWRTRPLLLAEDATAVGMIDESLAFAERILRHELPCNALNDSAEQVYQLAASIAARSRISGSRNHRQAAAAGAVLHCTIDGIADLDHDPQATLGCAILALRSCGKLDNTQLSNEIRRDIEQLRSARLTCTFAQIQLSNFGPLWGVEMPEWARSR